jgi:hypothetical protein
MTREEFIKILDEKGYSYKIEGDKIVITYESLADLDSLTSLPPGVEFKNEGAVNLISLTSLPPGVKFENVGNVYLGSLKSLPPGVKFENVGNVYLRPKSLPPGVEFKNEGTVNLGSIVGGFFESWKGNIEGIDSKRLLNLMIKRGIFE